MVRMEFSIGMIHIVLVMLLLVKAIAGGSPRLPSLASIRSNGNGKGGATVMAKEGCVDTCGGVSIPYPFGIGPNCYANQSYAITCNSYIPFLTSLNLEVLDISVGSAEDPAYLKVRNPINHTYMNLSGTPFSFSSSNILFGLGCNILAQILSPTPTAIIAQCTTICNNGTSSSSNNTILEGDGKCYGINCCSTYVPPLLKVVNISLSTIGTSSSDNKNGFLVDNDWFIQKSGLANLVRSTERVPVNLIWKTDEMCYATRRNFTYTLFKHSDEYSNCHCDWLPSGSPYLQTGCPTDSSRCPPPGIVERNCTSDGACHAYCNIPDISRSRSRSRSMKFVFVGLGSGLGGLFMIMGAWWLRKIIKRRNKAKLKMKFFKRNGGLLLQKQLCSAEQVYVDNTKLFSSKELETATDHYNENRVLGRGGQGTVYKGMLTDGKIVAVKKSKIVDEGKLDEFINEVVILSQINHRNVVKLHGCCLETEVPLLVYDFIPNGTLFQYMHHQENEDFPLTWDARLRIASEVAGALFYLHSAASLPIYHRDIKSSNILLDDKYRAKVADFGTSRSAAVEQTHMTTRVQGTFGYLDPEYYQSSQFTAKSDVYSFGVVLVELLTGQKAVLPITFMEGRSLATYFMLSMKKNRLFDTVDAQVLKEGRKGEIVGVANLAYRCLNLNGRKRPTMKEVAMELEAIKTTHAGSAHFQVDEHNEEVDDYGIIQLADPFNSTATSSITSLVGR